MTSTALARTILAILLALAGLGSPVLAQEESGSAAPGSVTVAVREVPPFAMRDEAGNWTGLSVDLWQDVADQRNIGFDWVELPLDDTIAGLESGEVDAAIAAISVTQEREAALDFSHPYYVAGLTTAFSGTQQNAWLATLSNFASWQFLSAVGSLAIVLLIAGFFMWLFERKANAEEFGDGSVSRGLGDGFWWSAVTMTTVGYGDKAPRTTGGRVVALVWMFLSLIIIASFTASIAASLTANQLGEAGLRDEALADLDLGTLSGSAAEEFAAAQGARTQQFDDVDAALTALEDGEVEAVLHDAPILRYMSREDDRGVEVSSGVLVRDDYAFAFPAGSELREDVNLALLGILFEPSWKEMRQRYLGSVEEQEQ